MPSFNKKYWMPIILAIFLAYPTWHYFIKDLVYLPGPIYNTPDETLRHMLTYSDIKQQLRQFQFVIIKPALDTQLKGGRYTGSRNLRCYKTKMYLELLEDILSRNKDKIHYHIDGKNKVIVILLRNQLENL